MAAEVIAPSSFDSGYHARWHEARIWFGAGLRGMLQMLRENRFDVDACCLHKLLIDACSWPWQSALGTLQSLLYSRRVERVRLDPPPVFVLGHWRSGTTLLHELLAADPRHAAPTTYECFAPNHFLLTERLAPLVRFLIPDRRPMDAMPAGWQNPQEEEFALLALGVPSIYRTLAFPNRPPQCREYLDLRDLPPRELERWKRVYVRFLKQVALQHRQRRLVVKSPTNTARVRLLLELFPEARFVNIVRDPYQVIDSTLHTWRTLYHAYGYQRPSCEHLQEHVLETFRILHERLEEDRPLVKPGRFAELRYEDLVADPQPQLARIHERLELGPVEPAREPVRQLLAHRRGHRTNRHAISPALRRRIAWQCGAYRRRYGYA